MEKASRRALYGLLLATVGFPALAVVHGLRGGEVVFVLYREPKLVAVQILGAFLLAAVVAVKGHLLFAELAAELRRPPVVLLLLLVAWMAVTAAWVEVAENLVYELSQYLLLVPLLVAMLAWARLEARVVPLVRGGLVASLGILTAVGLLQRAWPTPWLPPIDPQFGVSNPSLMGYKNPMALALLGQVFLLAGLVLRPTRGRWPRWALGSLLVVELLYLAGLRSRTAYAALALAGLFVLGLYLLRAKGRHGRALAALAAAVLVFGVAVAASDGVRARVASAFAFVGDPASYLESDRGTYLRNSLNMVRHRPLGVGLGDWQTQYPVYRLVNRSLAFTDTHQVRRAHSDHVQMLAETGWPGLVLWAGFLLAALWVPVRRFRKGGGLSDLFAAGQLAALTAAMATDYVIEIPYHKLQLFLVVFLALAPPRPAERGEDEPAPPGHRGLARALAAALLGLALLSAARSTSLARKVSLSADFTHDVLQVEKRLGARGPQARGPEARLAVPEIALLGTVLERGRAFDRTAGHTKTQHKDYLVLAHAARLLGQGPLARAYCREALRLHPYSPNGLALMADLHRDQPERAAAWQAAYLHVKDEATRGFEMRYPRLED